MQRQLKFRVRTPDGEWRYFGLRDVSQIVLNWDTVGQFCGLTDKNGKEIYEGDIIHRTFRKVPKSPNWSVVWDEKKARWLFGRGEYSRFALTVTSARDYEVIGNIYENPDLLSV